MTLRYEGALYEYDYEYCLSQIKSLLSQGGAIEVSFTAEKYIS